MTSTTRIRIAAFGTLLLLAFAPALQAGDGSKGRKWIQLFNGKNLDGWIVKIKGHDLGDNFANTFRVEDGILKVSYDGYDEFRGQFGHLFYYKEFSNYRLRVTYRFVGEQLKGGAGWAFRNSGLMLHGQKPESMEKDQNFPVSIEVQLLGGRDKGVRTTANLCTPGTNVVMNGKLCTRHCTSSRSKTYRGDQWVTVEVEVRGNAIKHIMEGKTVLEYTDPQLDERDANARRLLKAGRPKMLRGGTISLQSESHPVEFRKVELLPLDGVSEVGTAESEEGWENLLEGSDISKHRETTGNSKLDREGVVTLTPRPGIPPVRNPSRPPREWGHRIAGSRHAATRATRKGAGGPDSTIERKQP